MPLVVEMKVLRLICCAGLVACSSARAQLTLLDGIAAIVNDAVVTFQEVRNYVEPSLVVLRNTYGNQPEVFEQRRIDAFARGLEDLVEKQLILDDFKAQGGAIPDSIIEDEIKGIIRKRYGDQATLTKSLQVQGKTRESLRQEIRQEIVVGYLRQKNISQAVLISPAKIEDYYATNLAQYKQADQVKMRVIVLNCSPGTVEEVHLRAQEILAKIADGALFPEMASVYSEGSQARQQGDWGWVESSKKNGLSEIAFGLKPGEFSSVIGKAQVSSDSYWVYQYDKTGNLSRGRRYSGRDELVEEKRFDPGAAPPVPPQEFYLIKVDEKRPARTLSLDEARDDIERTLISLERNRLQKRWVERLKAKSFVTTY